MSDPKLEKLLIQKVISEIENPVYESTEQLLKCFSIERSNGQPEVQLIDTDSSDEVDIVYVVLNGVPFFQTYCFSKVDNELVSKDTESSNQIYFTATSKSKSFDELAEMTQLQGLKGWSFDQLRPNGKTKYGFTRIRYEPIQNRAFDFHTKLSRLLVDLTTDKEGVRMISSTTNAIISIHLQMYLDGNQGITLNKEIIASLSDLNLGLDIDQYTYSK